ncbi:protein SSUH2 homolog [Parasteatoda tepidariorum]|uniref:protein SSUH2 homolog n=1 Tax=Parasteatoda tepidariorum TaxID=114398 RepID=UPI0039BC6A12
MSKTLDFLPDIDSSDLNTCATNPCYQPEEVVVCPPSNQSLEQICTERPPLINLGSLTAEEVRDACLQYASNNCCYGKKFVRETIISSVNNGCTYHYKLESFGEKRETAKRTTPYLGQVIDGPENGTPPSPWDIPVTIPGLFMDNKRTFEVPHTAYVKDCWNCVGNCKIRCDVCNGIGGSCKDQADRENAIAKMFIRTYLCDGHDVTSAKDVYDTLIFKGRMKKTKVSVIEINKEKAQSKVLSRIKGKGIDFDTVKEDENEYEGHLLVVATEENERWCSNCIGTGQVKCHTCKGKGKLKHFLMLIVTWKNHASDFISDTSKLPKELILEVSGRELFKEQQTKVYPVNHCPDPAVNQASQTLLMQHQCSFPNELIRMQKQTLRAVPLTIANYSWKDREGEFYVFGFQNKVYFEKYPQKCCCCTCF